MKRRSKLYVFAMVSAGIALSGSLQGNDADSASYKLIVNGGTGTGEYAPGTMVIVSASGDFLSLDTLDVALRVPHPTGRSLI
jgi:hypothetical protein